MPPEVWLFDECPEICEVVLPWELLRPCDELLPWDELLRFGCQLIVLVKYEPLISSDDLSMENS